MANLQLLRPLLETVVIIGMTFLAGIAACLELWAIPLIMLQENTSRSMIAQFNELIRRGGKFLQPSSRACAISLVALAVLTAQHPDEAISNRWKLYAGAGVVVAQVAWYEVMFIFPINAQITAMGQQLDSKGNLSSVERKKLLGLLEQWARFHWGRILLPLAAAVIAFQAVLT